MIACVTPNTAASQMAHSVQVYLADQKHPPPEDHDRSLGIAPLQGPRRGVFLVGEVPLYRGDSASRSHTARRVVLGS